MVFEVSSSDVKSCSGVAQRTFLIFKQLLMEVSKSCKEKLK